MTDKDNILIADSKKEFLAAIQTLSEHLDLREKMRTNARITYEKYYSNASLSKKLDKVLQQHAEPGLAKGLRYNGKVSSTGK
ncbi:hypothetical protein QS257_18580 [Terrilactibacillus sp. S3-3]|nr:hypothetical protein QS257_18580 [Terrilactibacillus sp. S3-3]